MKEIKDGKELSNEMHRALLQDRKSMMNGNMALAVIFITIGIMLLPVALGVKYFADSRLAGYVTLFISLGSLFISIIPFHSYRRDRNLYEQFKQRVFTWYTAILEDKHVFMGGDDEPVYNYLDFDNLSLSVTLKCYNEAVIGEQMAIIVSSDGKAEAAVKM